MGLFGFQQSVKVLNFFACDLLRMSKSVSSDVRRAKVAEPFLAHRCLCLRVRVRSIDVHACVIKVRSFCDIRVRVASSERVWVKRIFTHYMSSSCLIDLLSILVVGLVFIMDFIFVFEVSVLFL